MTRKIRCELVSWNKVYRLSRRLSHLVRETGFDPDIVVAIARGGYVPARLVCDFLDIYNLTSVRISHYTAGATKTDRARLSVPLCVDVRGMNVLIIDDVSDTGETLALADEHIKNLDPAGVKIGVLHHKTVSSVEPDIYAEKVVKWRWLIYPWAVVEDISGFLKNMQDTPKTYEDAARRLNEYYDIDISRKILEDVFVALRS